MTKFHASTMMRHRDQIREVLDLLTDERLEEIERRSEHASKPDGYPSGGDGVAVATSDIADPTGSCVAQQIDEPRHPADPQMVAFAAISKGLAKSAAISRALRFAWSAVEHVGDRRKGRGVTTLGSCNACGRDVANSATDRIVSGYCEACRSAWRRAGCPDRVAFEADRRAYLAGVMKTEADH